MPISEPWTITLDGASYNIKINSYQLENVVLVNYRPTARGQLDYQSSGVFKKKFKAVVLCDNNGVSGDGKVKRDAVRVSLNKTTPLTFVTPDGDSYNVLTEGNFSESIKHDPAHPLGFEYEVDISLIEA